MTHRAVTIPALLLIASVLPAASQTGPSAFPPEQAAALLPALVSPKPILDPRAPRWMLLEGYGRHGEVGYHWEPVRPRDFDVTNYRGFHTPGQ